MCVIVSCSAGFLSQAGLGTVFSGLAEELGRLEVRRLPGYATTCLDRDSHQELRHRLVTLSECYRTGPNLEESSDSD